MLYIFDGEIYLKYSQLYHTANQTCYQLWPNRILWLRIYYYAREELNFDFHRSTFNRIDENNNYFITFFLSSSHWPITKLHYYYKNCLASGIRTQYLILRAIKNRYKSPDCLGRSSHFDGGCCGHGTTAFAIRHNNIILFTV